MNAPLSPHWADVAALKLIKTKGDKESYVLASGITPSGLVHVGNFRETITVDLVARALKALGKKVTFLYSWDNFDTFRKVPKNLPDPEAFKEHLGKPIARIPDPWGQAESYAKGRMDLFEKELVVMGIKPQFRYQESLYKSGLYGEHIRHILENVDKIKNVLNQYRTEPLAEGWLPTATYCGRCSKDDMKEDRYLGEWSYTYHCQSCDFQETVDLRTTQNMKLVWRVDWPMRWHHEGVDFEPGGKDHSSQGGSFDTAKDIIRAVWGEEPPSYLQYDFVMIKGGAGKMSSSSGELFTLSQVLEVYEPQVIRWIFSNQRPNHDFALAFDEDVIKIYDEFDRAEKLAFTPGANPMAKRTYELSRVDDSQPLSTCPERAGFRVLCNRLQICHNHIDRTFERYYSHSDRTLFTERARRAVFWLTHYAPEEFCYGLQKEKQVISLEPKDKEALSLFRDLMKNLDLETISTKDLNETIWDRVINPSQIDSGVFFSLVYRHLIGRNQGPRLPGFLKEIGKEKILELI